VEFDMQFKNSYACLVDYLKADAQIVMGCPVKSINYSSVNHDTTSGSDHNSEASGDIVKVTTVHGDTYSCETLVVTASPHVLKSGVVAFDPPMSSALKAALDTLTMRSVVKVILKFSAPVWPKDLHGMIVSDKDFLLPEIWFKAVEGEADADEPAKAYAVGYTTSEYAEKIEKMTKSEVISKCVAQLDTMFGMLEPEHMAADLTEAKLSDPKALPKPSEAFLGGVL
jgi:monoamine oxidase